MKISLLTLFPELYQPFLNTSLIARAQDAGTLDIVCESLFDYADPKERIDAPTFGHNAGMVLRPSIMETAIDSLEERRGKSCKVFFSPQGKKLTQSLARDLAQQFQEAGHVMLIASRYEGVDERVQEYYADHVVSVGDFVVMGGDLPAMLFMEAVVRYVPGVVGKQESVERDSFSGPWVDYPEYSPPVEWKGLKVPDIVRSGNHGAIALWRERQAVNKTVMGHFEWLREYPYLTSDQIAKAKEFIPMHYCVLMHSDIQLGPDLVGTTSVTSIDIHDIARSAATYGLEGYFIVTPLLDQQKIVGKLLDFWNDDRGREYNKSRSDAVCRVHLVSTLDEVCSEINRRHGVDPLLVATSAKVHPHVQEITYHDTEIVWAHKRPVLFVFGTGKGLAQKVIDRCDYLLGPLRGFSDYNHLSVRSAAAIIFDRWLGLNKRRQ